MRKLLLRLDDLRVESFATGRAARSGGTVAAREASGAGCAYTLLACPASWNCPSNQPTCGIQQAPAANAEAPNPLPDTGTTGCYACCM